MSLNDKPAGTTTELPDAPSAVAARGNVGFTATNTSFATTWTGAQTGVSSSLESSSSSSLPDAPGVSSSVSPDGSADMGAGLMRAPNIKTAPMVQGSRFQFSAHIGYFCNHLIKSPNDIRQPDGTLGGFNQHNNQITFLESTVGHNISIGAGRFNNSFFKPTEMVYARKNFFESDAGPVKIKADAVVGATYGYKKGEMPGVQVGKSLVSPMAGVIISAQANMGKHVSVGVEELITPVFVTTLATTGTALPTQQGALPTATMKLHW